MAARWSDRAASDPEVADWLDYPGYVRSEAALGFVADAEPTVRVLRLKLDDERHKVLVDQLDVERDNPKQPGLHAEPPPPRPIVGATPVLRVA